MKRVILLSLQWYTLGKQLLILPITNYLRNQEGINVKAILGCLWN